MITFLLPSIVLFLFYILIEFYIHKKIVRITFLNHLVNTTFAIYIIAVLSITQFPFPTDPRLIEDSVQSGYELGMNFIPLKTIIPIVIDAGNGTNGFQIVLKQLVGNIILFYPFGFYLPLISNRIFSFSKVILFGLLFTTLVEALQGIGNLFLGFNYRAVDIDDMILNLVGVVFGYLTIKYIFPFISKYIKFY